MTTLDAFILGLVQGLAEYLPISSSGHLVICREILGIDLSGADSLKFDVMLHVATVLSTIVILWNEFRPLCVSFFTFRRDQHFDTVLKIIISCIPVGIVGLFFKDAVESFFGEGLTIVGCCLLATALLLSFSYFFRTRKLSIPGRKSYTPRDITYLDAFIIGLSQAVAVLPGLSRSGTTIATGLLIGCKQDKVANFSFLMVIVPILGQALLDLKDAISEPNAADAAIGFMPMAIGFITSFIVGCIACKWMLNIVRRGKLVYFAIYCLAAAILCLVF